MNPVLIFFVMLFLLLFFTIFIPGFFIEIQIINDIPRMVRTRAGIFFYLKNKYIV